MKGLVVALELVNTAQVHRAGPGLGARYVKEPFEAVAGVAVVLAMRIKGQCSEHRLECVAM